MYKKDIQAKILFLGIDIIQKSENMETECSENLQVLYPRGFSSPLKFLILPRKNIFSYSLKLRYPLKF